jgi:CRP/FNR family cyclic AMP-dependent transcriptional regulator
MAKHEQASNIVPLPHDGNSDGALFLAERSSELNEGAEFLDKLSDVELSRLRQSGRAVKVSAGEGIFFQGDPHGGIYLIEEGLVRTFYNGPSGREITLAHWTPGHFVGGPEVFGGGLHIWSGEAMTECRLLFLTGSVVRELVETIPAFALAVIDGLVAKGKCYSALVQMLGTRSVAQRLAQLLLIMSETQGHEEEGRLWLERRVTHDQLAVIVGSTRQWVSTTLDRLQKDGVISIDGRRIAINRVDVLRSMAES